MLDTIKGSVFKSPKVPRRGFCFHLNHQSGFGTSSIKICRGIFRKLFKSFEFRSKTDLPIYILDEAYLFYLN